MSESTRNDVKVAVIILTLLAMLFGGGQRVAAIIQAPVEIKGLKATVTEIQEVQSNQGFVLCDLAGRPAIDCGKTTGN